MSLKLGNTPIAGISQNTKYNAHHLLDFKWTDCIMNDVSWLRADTFSWQSGDVYTSAYNHLVADLQGATSETETIGSYTITFYRATDGHKICLADMETTVLNIYNSYGIAWYYILDTVNTRFKLPRTKYGFEGIRNNVGDNIEAGLPNITSNGYNLASPAVSVGQYGAITVSSNRPAGFQGAGSTYILNSSLDASLASTIYGNSSTVQPPATQMYLYFYVGDYSQTAIEQTAGLNSELFNGKADVDLNNMNPSQSAKDTIMEYGIPDYSSGISITFTYGTSVSYTAPTKGFISLDTFSLGTNGGTVTINGNSVVVGASSGSSTYARACVQLYVDKDDVIVVYSYGVTTSGTFYPLKGVN